MFFENIKEKLSKQNKVRKPKKFILSDDAVRFIKSYAMTELNIVLPIDEDKFDDIFDFAEMCELNMMDDEGNDRQEDYPEKERDILGDKFVGEVSGNYGKDNEPDLVDLNSRLA